MLTTMHPLKGQIKLLLSSPLRDIMVVPCVNASHWRVKDYPIPQDYSRLEAPERNRLPLVKKIPLLPPGQRVLKAKRNVAIQRGPEMVNNMFLHKQFGIVALEGGRMRFEHFEMARMVILRRMTNDMYAIWRIDDPWQPISKKSQGKPMGGGKGAVDHYATPVRANRVILEMGGKCHWDEVKYMLNFVCSKLPFASKAYAYKDLLAERKLEELVEEENQNYFTFKYCVQNKMAGCHNWYRPIDRLFFGKYYSPY